LQKIPIISAVLRVLKRSWELKTQYCPISKRCHVSAYLAR